MTLTPAPRGGFAFHATAPFRRAPRGRTRAQSRGTAVERADLHALLVRGDFAVVARGRKAKLSGSYPFLVAERLLQLAEEALDASQGGRAIFRRIQLGDCRVGVRRGPGDGASRRHRRFERSPRMGAGKSITFPAICALDFASATVAFARRLAEAFSTADPAQERNLRLKCPALSNADDLADRVERQRGRRLGDEPRTRLVPFLRDEAGSRVQCQGLVVPGRQDAVSTALGRDGAEHRSEIHVPVR